jgi:hypothetical protein
MTDPRPDRTGPAGPITSQTPTSPHLSRLVWLGEQLTETADLLAELFHHEQILADLSGPEFTALRAATAAARTAGGDVVLIASAAHQRLTEGEGPR